MILILDNYDGCANNIYQLAGEFDPDIRIVRNDRIGPEEILTLKPDHMILSGGSAAPEEAGRDLEIVQTCAGKIPLLGVCLGYRVICASYGASCVQMREIRQGKLLHDGRVVDQERGVTGADSGPPMVDMGDFADSHTLRTTYFHGGASGVRQVMLWSVFLSGSFR